MEIVLKGPVVVRVTLMSVTDLAIWRESTSLCTDASIYAY
jgi:hypothetical protein